METSKKTLLVLAGGLGSRYKSLKQVDGMLNESTILEYSVYDALQAGFNKIVFIINNSVPKEYIDRISEVLANKNVDYHWIIQSKSDFVTDEKLLAAREKPWGTAHAVLCASSVINENFVVINADDYYGKTIYETAFNLLSENKTNAQNYSIVAFPLKNTVSANGSVSRGICTVNKDNKLDSVDEITQIFSENNEIYYVHEDKKNILDPETLVSMNFWVINPNFFKPLEKSFQTFLQENPAPKAEFFLPVNIDQMLKNKEVAVNVEKSSEMWKGITYPEDKLELQEFLKEKVSQNIYPEFLWKQA